MAKCGWCMQYGPNHAECKRRQKEYPDFKCDCTHRANAAKSKPVRKKRKTV